MTHGAYETGLHAANWAITAGHQHVIIVGAGMAGLGAARQLLAHGVTTEIHEARERTGGRTTGIDVGGFTFDLGANWLQQYDDNLLARLAEQWELRVVPTDFGSEDCEGELRERLAAAPEHASVADVRDAWLHPAHRRPTSTGSSTRPSPSTPARHSTGSAPGTASNPASATATAGLSAATGYSSTAWRQGLPISLDTPVRDIRIDADGAVINEDVRADAVIVTVPLGPLRDITFTPALPEQHRTALTHLGAGRVEKIIMRLDRRFWTAPYFRIHGPASGSISEWLDATEADGTPTLVGLFAGPWLDDLWTGDDIAGRILSDVLRAGG
ncbi:flavin monoamine oxidase family protein [Catenuloplanes sp. NPDC051500]|uniref:flavin monoamine oxidase family protein n=1 Tax=Catenuloplanes sp. NPDC051500 TaxID=3363959 RepID=UPI0037AB5926